MVVFNHEFSNEPCSKCNPPQNVLKRSKEVTWEYNKEHSKKQRKRQKFKIRFKMIFVVIVDYYWLFFVQFVCCLFLVLTIYSMPSSPNRDCTISKCFRIYSRNKNHKFLFLYWKFSSYNMNHSFLEAGSGVYSIT